MPKLFDDDGTPTINLFWLIVGIIILICIIYYVLIRYVFLPGHGIEAWGQRGTVGDTFGAINALFAGAGFAGAIFVILLQRADLKRQQQESKQQEERQQQELAKQAKNFNEQLEEIKKQTTAFCSQVEQNKLQTETIIKQFSLQEKQTNAILEQLLESKEQTKAINEEAKESAKQTKELSRQIQLSILPGFIVKVCRHIAISDERANKPTTAVGLELTNIGNGTAMNIIFVDVHFNPDKLKTRIVEFERISYLKPHDKKVVRFKIKEFDHSTRKYQELHSLNSPTDTSRFLDHLESNSEEKPFQLAILFMDIEANMYGQKIGIFKDGIVVYPVQYEKDLPSIKKLQNENNPQSTT